MQKPLQNGFASWQRLSHAAQSRHMPHYAERPADMMLWATTYASIILAGLHLVGHSLWTVKPHIGRTHVKLCSLFSHHCLSGCPSPCINTLQQLCQNEDPRRVGTATWMHPSIF